MERIKAIIEDMTEMLCEISIVFIDTFCSLLGMEYVGDDTYERKENSNTV